MVRIGYRVPWRRVPACRGGRLEYLSLDRFSSRWMLLCFLPRLTAGEAKYLHSHVRSGPEFEQEAALLAVGHEETVLHQPWSHRIGHDGLVLVGDPLQRLHRAFGVPAPARPPRCQSFLIDPQGVLQFLLVHDLRGSGLQALTEILKAGLTNAGQNPEGHVSPQKHTHPTSRVTSVKNR